MTTTDAETHLELRQPRLARHLTIEALASAARWPNAAPPVVLSLVGMLAASRRFDEAYRLFDELATERPDQPLLLAAAASFQARLPGQLDAALGKLDAAVAAMPGLPHYLRGLVLAELPARAADAVTDLEFVLALGDRFPVGLRRPVFRGLTLAYAQLSRTEDAQEARHRAGLDVQPDLPQLSSDHWVTDVDGFRFAPRKFRELAEGIFVTQGFGFGEIGFIVTETSLVVIDAGSTEEQARAALAAMHEISPLPVSHVILTHGHWDHIGGLDALRSPGVEVIAQAGLPAELAVQDQASVAWNRFLPAGARRRHQVVADRLIDEPETLTVGGVELHLLPVHGGETHDALLIQLPERGIVFVGDILMPQLGAPFFAEGSAEGLLDTLGLIEELAPALLVHGHAPLTAGFTVAALTGLRPALADLYQVVRADIAAGRSVFDILGRNHLPEVLRTHPDSVIPYVLLRDNLIRRVQRQRTGYWQPELDSIDPVAPAEWAGALELLSGGRPQVYVEAIENLLDRDDLPLALGLAEAALTNHPDDDALSALRRRTLVRLAERNQNLAPFKFVVYSELAGLTVSELTD